MERVVGKRFKLICKIGAGSFGQIYKGEDLKNGKEVAIKLETSKSSSPQLSYESKLYNKFEGSISVPRIYWYGTEGHYNIMAVELLGKSLEDQLSNNRQHLTLKTVLMLADQMISCVEFLHKKDYIHRDIKPDNFVMGVGNNSNKVYIIDFGLSKRYRDQITHQHIAWIDGKSLTGTARYASVNALRGIEQSRRDDMEALGYVWMYLLKGSLPWMGLRGKDQHHKYDRICEVKQKTPIEELCRGYPNEFREYLESVKSLHFTEEPKYSEYRRKFRELFERLGYIYDGEYDWTERRRNRNDINARSFVISNPNQNPNRIINHNEIKKVVNRPNANINVNGTRVVNAVSNEKEIRKNRSQIYEIRKNVDDMKRDNPNPNQNVRLNLNADKSLEREKNKGTEVPLRIKATKKEEEVRRVTKRNIRMSQLPRWMVDLD